MADLYSPGRRSSYGHFRISRSGAWGTCWVRGSAGSDECGAVTSSRAVFVPFAAVTNHGGFSGAATRGKPSADHARNGLPAREVLDRDRSISSCSIWARHDPESAATIKAPVRPLPRESCPPFLKPAQSRSNGLWRSTESTTRIRGIRIHLGTSVWCRRTQGFSAPKAPNQHDCHFFA